MSWHRAVGACCRVLVTWHKIWVGLLVWASVSLDLIVQVKVGMHLPDPPAMKVNEGKKVYNGLI